jgi:hypothetical protein
MSQKEVSITGKNNSKADVTGKGELLVKLGEETVSTISENISKSLETETKKIENQLEETNSLLEAIKFNNQLALQQLELLIEIKLLLRELNN